MYRAFFSEAGRAADSLPREVVQSSSLEMFKMQLDKALRKQVGSRG